MAGPRSNVGLASGGNDVFSCSTLAGRGLEARAGERCSMVGVACSWPARLLSGMAGVAVLRGTSRSFAEACGMLAFVYGDGVVELRGVERVRAIVRVNTPRPSTLFAAVARLLPFATLYSEGVLFCDKGRGGVNMCFKVPVDVILLEEYGLPGLAKGKDGVRRDLETCLDQGLEALLETLGGLIDSEGHVRKSSRFIEVGMKDGGLLEAVYRRLAGEGVEVSMARRADGLAVLRVHVGRDARYARMVNSIVNPAKRLTALRMLVPENATRGAVYREARRHLYMLLEAADKPATSRNCIECAKRVYSEASALASTADTSAETLSPPSPHSPHTAAAEVAGVAC